MTFIPLYQVIYSGHVCSLSLLMVQGMTAAPAARHALMS